MPDQTTYSRPLTVERVLEYFAKPRPQMLKPEEAIALACWLLVERGEIYTFQLTQLCPAPYAVSGFHATRAIQALMGAGWITVKPDLYMGCGQPGLGRNPLWLHPTTLGASKISELAALWASPLPRQILPRHRRKGPPSVEMVPDFYARGRAFYLSTERAIAYFAWCSCNNLTFSATKIFGHSPAPWRISAVVFCRAIAFLEASGFVRKEKIKLQPRLRGKPETIYVPASEAAGAKQLAEAWANFALGNQ